MDPAREIASMIGFDITLLNIEKNKAFVANQEAIEALVKSFNAKRKGGERHAVESVHTRNRQEVTEALIMETNLLHVMAHGTFSGTVSSKRPLWLPKKFHIELLRQYCEDQELSPAVDCVLMDACETFGPDWFREVKKLVAPGKSVIYIGTSREVEFDETTTYTGAFYLSFMQRSWTRRADLRRGIFKQAHRDAASFYSKTTRENCPFRMREIHSPYV